MHTTFPRNRQQQKRINTHKSSANCFSFFNLLTSDSLFDKLEALLPEHRERLYPPTETLSMFLAQTMNADRSCQNIVNQSSVNRIAGGLTSGSTSTGAYCRARKRLPVSLITEMTHEVGHLIDEHTPPEWLWKNRRVCLVDGTSMTMPDTEENQKEFPQLSAQKTGLGFPICRLVGITCLASGALLNAAMGRFNGKGNDEQSLLRSIQNDFKPGDIVMGDAFFATYFFIAEMQARGVDILMEQHGSRQKVVDFDLGKSMGEKDHLIVIHKPKTCPSWMSQQRYDTSPSSLTVREVKVSGKVLVTTMNCPNYAHKNELKKLYRQRWNIELDIRDIKTTMGMNILGCKTPDMVIKEIWVYLLAYNLIRLLMAQSALLADIRPRSISFKHCLQLWQSSLQILNLLNEPDLLALFSLISQQRVGKRPGRIEPRAL